MTRAQSAGMVAHWQDPEVRKRRERGVERRRELWFLRNRLDFLLERADPDDPRILPVQERIADLQGEE